MRDYTRTNYGRDAAAYGFALYGDGDGNIYATNGRVTIHFTRLHHVYLWLRAVRLSYRSVEIRQQIRSVT